MGHDAAPGHVVVDDGGVDPASPHHPGLLYGPDDQLSDPVRDVVHLPPGVELLIARPPLRQLTAVGVALTKEVFGPDIIFFVCVTESLPMTHLRGALSTVQVLNLPLLASDTMLSIFHSMIEAEVLSNSLSVSTLSRIFFLSLSSSSILGQCCHSLYAFSRFVEQQCIHTVVLYSLNNKQLYNFRQSRRRGSYSF